MIRGFHRFAGAGLLLFAVQSAIAAIYVNAITGNDYSGNGTSGAPYKTLQYAIDWANSGDVIRLAAGNYEGAMCSYYKNLTVVGANYKTVFIRENGSSYGGILNYGGGEVVVRAVTFTNVGDPAYGVTLVNSVISNCYSTIATDCMLYNCLIVDNKSNWDFQYAISGCWLYGCTYANTVSSGYSFPGLSADCRAYNTIVWNNRYEDGSLANAEDESTLFSCHGMAASDDPRFVCADCGDYRLRSDSPCCNAGSVAYASTDVSTTALNGKKRVLNTYPDIGCFESGYVSGYVISTRATGRGNWSPAYTVVSSGGSATFTARCGGRPISSMSVDGVAVTPATVYTFSNVRSDHVLAATFVPSDYYVDPINGDDARAGTSWATAKATIGAAVAEARDEEEVVVTNGTVKGSFTVPDGMVVRSVNGAEATVIDLQGGHIEGGYSSDLNRNSVVRGFTVTNGSGYYGGAFYKGRAEDCVITGNAATSYGGAALWTTLVNCRVFGNRAVSGGSALSEGYAYGCIFSNNVIAGTSSGWTIGAAVNASTCYNCLIVDNHGSTPGTFNSTGAANSYLYNCTVAGNRCEGGTPSASGANSCGLYNTIVAGNGTPDDGLPQHGADRALGRYYDGADAVFVDPEHGDYHLVAGTACINGGDNGQVSDSVDLDGQPRIIRKAVDLGCYEFQPTNDLQTITVPIPVAFSWLDQHCASAVAAAGGDYDVAVQGFSSNVVTAADGTRSCRPLWESYLIGLDPNDTNAQWHATIAVTNGVPTVGSDPYLANRRYTVLGKHSLTDEVWSAECVDPRFFRVRVELK